MQLRSQRLPPQSHAKHDDGANAPLRRRHRQFVEEYTSVGYSSEIKENCLKMYVNGLGFRAIERVTGVNHNTIIRWVRKSAIALPHAPEVSEIPEITEIDELQTFVGKKK